MNFRALTFTSLVVSMAGAGAVTVTVDPSAVNSILFQDYRAAPGATTFNNAQLQGADGGGTTVYETNGTAGDPQVTHGGGSLDLNTYPNFRTRYSVTNGGGANSVNAWRNPAAGGQQVIFDDGAAGLTEFQSTIPNPTAGVSGFRLDPIGDGTTWSIELDYMYVDRGRTIGFEFDHDGDEQGLLFNGAYASRTVAGGSLSGAAALGGGAASDTNINFSPFFATIDPDIYKFVEIEMSGNAGDRIDLFYRNTATAGGPKSFAFESSSDGQNHTYLIDFTGDTDWSGTLNFLRLDPTVASGGTFDIQSIRFYETAIIPEPGSAALALLGVLGLVVRRRR